MGLTHAVIPPAMVGTIVSAEAWNSLNRLADPADSRKKPETVRAQRRQVMAQRLSGYQFGH
jgi:hypothetical protein